MCKYWLLLLSFFLLARGYAQTAQLKTDSQYVFSMDLFTSESERKLFTSVATGKEINYLSLFLLSDPSFKTSSSVEGVNERITSFVSNSGFVSKGENYKSKDLKKLYKDIHDAFLSQYIENPRFSQMFEDGGFNCATATALYALLLDQFSIQYHIRETPDHVYIIADPEKNNVVFETTAPGASFYTISEKDKTKFVEYLYNNKIISKEQWITGDKKQLFDRYYYSDEVIDKRKLAGLLYYNLGIAAFNNENQEEAYKNFEKAYFLYPSARIKYFVSVCLVNVLLKNNMSENEHAYPYYLRLIETFNKDLAEGMLKEYMENVTQRLLFKSPQAEKYFQFYKKVSPQVKDSALSKDIRYTHYYHAAHYYSIKGKYDSSLLYLDSVYALNKDDLLVQELVTGTVEEILKKLGEDEQALMKSLNDFFVRYPFIDRYNSRFGDVYALCLTRAALKSYKADKKKEGANYLSEIEALMKKQTDFLKKNENYLTAAVLEGYYYYVRHREYKEAKTFLLHVTTYLPNNEEVQLRIKRINEILEN